MDFSRAEREKREHLGPSKAITFTFGIRGTAPQLASLLDPSCRASAYRRLLAWSPGSSGLSPTGPGTRISLPAPLSLPSPLLPCSCFPQACADPTAARQTALDLTSRYCYTQPNSSNLLPPHATVAHGEGSGSLPREGRTDTSPCEVVRACPTHTKSRYENP